MSMLVDFPLQLPRGPNTLLPSPNCRMPMQNNTPQLAAWRLSGNSSQQEKFHMRLQTSFSEPGDKCQLQFSMEKVVRVVQSESWRSLFYTHCLVLGIISTPVLAGKSILVARLPVHSILHTSTCGRFSNWTAPSSRLILHVRLTKGAFSAFFIFIYIYSLWCLLGSLVSNGLVQSIWFLLVSPSLYGLPRSPQSLWCLPVSMVSSSLYGLPQSLWFLSVSFSLSGLWCPPVSMVSPNLSGLLQSLWSPSVSLVGLGTLCWHNSEHNRETQAQRNYASIIDSLTNLVCALGGKTLMCSQIHLSSKAWTSNSTYSSLPAIVSCSWKGFFTAKQ